MGLPNGCRDAREHFFQHKKGRKNVPALFSDSAFFIRNRLRLHRTDPYPANAASGISSMDGILPRRASILPMAAGITQVLKYSAVFT